MSMERYYINQLKSRVDELQEAITMLCDILATVKFVTTSQALINRKRETLKEIKDLGKSNCVDTGEK